MLYGADDRSEERTIINIIPNYAWTGAGRHTPAAPTRLSTQRCRGAARHKIRVKAIVHERGYSRSDGRGVSIMDSQSVVGLRLGYSSIARNVSLRLFTTLQSDLR